jgi:hypothetical protein
MDAIDKLDKFHDMDENFNMDEIDTCEVERHIVQQKLNNIMNETFTKLMDIRPLWMKMDDFDTIAMHESFHMGEIQWSDMTI